jgi:tryptophan-rich sensory protein
LPAKVSFPRLIACVVLCELVGSMGSFFTTPAIPTWYASLKKPILTPPSWVFAPVWFALYVLMGFSLYIVWGKGLRKPNVRLAIATFGAQLILNLLWSVAFFGARSVVFGLVAILCLLAALVATVLIFGRISGAAQILLLPYLVWVAFATILNFEIALLN